MNKTEIFLDKTKGRKPIIIKVQSVDFPNVTDFGHRAGHQRYASPIRKISLPLIGEPMSVKAYVK